MAIEVISVGQADIEVEIHGTGIPVVLLPGLGMGISMLNDLAGRLNRAGFRTIGVNWRGIGNSLGSLEALTLRDLADDVAGVIQALKAAPVHVLGAAFGNRVARCVAQHHSSLVRSVILISAGGLVAPVEHVARLFQQLLFPNGQMSATEKAEITRKIFFSPATEAVKAKIGDRIWFDVIAAQVRAAQGAKLEDWWEGGDRPMLVIQGLDDLIAPPENGRGLRERHRDRVTLLEVEDAGHAILIEKPEEVANGVVSYLNNG